MDWNALCSDDFVTRFPDVRVGASSSDFARPPRLRQIEQLATAADVAYLLHHCHVASRLEDRRSPPTIPEYAVVRRRHALEWVLSDETWDALTLDT